MTIVNKVLAALLIIALSYLVYSAMEVRKDLFRVYDVPDQYTYGPTDADLIIVDFNKYGCDYCRALHPVLMEALKRDGKVRYIPRTVAYGQVWEETVATAVFAAGEQGKFIEMHNTVYENWPIDDRDTLFEHAQRIGLDIEKLSRNMSDPQIKNRVQENQMFFESWGLNRTPALLMGTRAIYSPREERPTVEGLLEKFERARS